MKLPRTVYLYAHTVHGVPMFGALVRRGGRLQPVSPEKIARVLSRRWDVQEAVEAWMFLVSEHLEAMHAR